MSLVRGVNAGKLGSMISNSSFRDTLLNILVRLAKMAAQVGRLFCSCGVIMCFLMDNCITFMIKSNLPLMPTA